MRDAWVVSLVDLRVWSSLKRREEWLPRAFTNERAAPWLSQTDVMLAIGLPPKVESTKAVAAGIRVRMAGKKKKKAGLR